MWLCSTHGCSLEFFHKSHGLSSEVDFPNSSPLILNVKDTNVSVIKIGKPGEHGGW